MHGATVPRHFSRGIFLATLSPQHQYLRKIVPAITATEKNLRNFPQRVTKASYSSLFSEENKKRLPRIKNFFSQEAYFTGTLFHWDTISLGRYLAGTIISKIWCSPCIRPTASAISDTSVDLLIPAAADGSAGNWLLTDSLTGN